MILHQSLPYSTIATALYDTTVLYDNYKLFVAIHQLWPLNQLF